MYIIILNCAVHKKKKNSRWQHASTNYINTTQRLVNNMQIYLLIKTFIHTLRVGEDEAISYSEIC